MGVSMNSYSVGYAYIFSFVEKENLTTAATAMQIMAVALGKIIPYTGYVVYTHFDNNLTYGYLFIVLSLIILLICFSFTFYKQNEKDKENK